MKEGKSLGITVILFGCVIQGVYAAEPVPTVTAKATIPKEIAAPIREIECCADTVIIKTEKIMHEKVDCTLPVGLLNYKDPCTNCGNIVVTMRTTDICVTSK